MHQRTGHISAQISKVINLAYLTYLPSNYDDSQIYPLIIFLHGFGERGNDLERVKVIGLPFEIEQGRELDAIVVAPQCPGDTRWAHEIPALSQLLDKLIDELPVDQSRIYLCGLSMGGRGTWWWSQAEPNRFAAIVPVCGAGDPTRAEVIAKLPVWAFHGALDGVVPPRNSENMIAELKNAGSNSGEVNHLSRCRT